MFVVGDVQAFARTSGISNMLAIGGVLGIVFFLFQASRSALYGVMATWMLIYNYNSFIDLFRGPR